jgi:Sulfotransferase family
MRRFATVRPRGPVRRYKYVFVVTYGRSGSTLLMGLLNTIPGYRIVGENANTLYRLYQADQALHEAHAKRGRDSNLPIHPWYGATDWRPDRFRQALVDAFVTNVLRPGRDDRVLGFKEIRYTQAHMKDLAQFLDFVRAAFPDSKIIFNHRVPDKVAASAWWADNPKALDQIKTADERMRAIPADDRHFHFEFDDIDDSLDNIRALFGWLGERVDEAAVRATLNRPHSYQPGGGGPVPSQSRGGRARVLARRVLGAARLR